MRVTYVGHGLKAVVPVFGPDGVDVEFPHGEPVEVPEPLGERLIESPNFIIAETRGKTRAPAARETAKER